MIRNVLALSLCLSCKTIPAQPASAVRSDDLAEDLGSQYGRYLADTLASLEMMRGRSGLIKDSVWVCWDADMNAPNIRDTEQVTSPTNIGLDLILLTQQATGGGATATAAAATLKKVLATLRQMPYHHANGLFFRTYWPDTAAPDNFELSSVDNLHLAFGLWVVAETLRGVDDEAAGMARELFGRMDFSDYYNTETGLIGGNMRPVTSDPQGAYRRDSFDYKYFGSEARSLYALGWALGLYKRAAKDIPDFDRKLLGPGIAGTVAETETLKRDDGPFRLLRTWDGGGFQALLPAVLVREDLYSPTLAALHHAYALRLLSDARDLAVPAAHSASAFGVKGLRLFKSGDKDFDDGLPIYNGAAGHVDMVATMHDDVNNPAVRRYWDLAYTPHPAFMAAVFARDAESKGRFAAVFKANEGLSSPGSCACHQDSPGGTARPAPKCACALSTDLANQPAGPDGVVGEPNLCEADASQPLPPDDRLYQSGLGWMDGYYVRGPFKGRVVPVMISLDQAMIALSLYGLLAPDGHNVASKAVAQNAGVVARLKQAYDAIEAKLAAIN